MKKIGPLSMLAAALLAASSAAFAAEPAYRQYQVDNFGTVITFNRSVEHAYLVGKSLHYHVRFLGHKNILVMHRGPAKKGSDAPMYVILAGQSAPAVLMFHATNGSKPLVYKYQQGGK